MPRVAVVGAAAAAAAAGVYFAYCRRVRDAGGPGEDRRASARGVAKVQTPPPPLSLSAEDVLEQQEVEMNAEGHNLHGRRGQLWSLFTRTKFVSCLDEKYFVDLLDDVAFTELSAGDILFKANDDSSSGMHICVRGCLGVYDGTSFLSSIGPAQSIGDLDVLDGRPRKLSVVAEEHTSIVTVSRCVSVVSLYQ